MVNEILRPFARLLIGFVLAITSVPVFAAGQPKGPNFVVIMADDLGYGDVGCYGSRRNQTPKIDALARDGMRFTDFHSSGTVCSPTRAGLLTGRYQQRSGIPAVITAANHRDVGLPLEEITFAERLKQAGYSTAMFGKWHLGYQRRFNPVHQGFEQFRGYVSGNVDYVSHVDQTGIADWWDGDKLVPEQGYSTELITKHAVEYIEQNQERPFCLYVAHESPHYPYQGPGDKAERLVGKTFKTQGARADIRRAYAEMIASMDEGVGQIVATLKRLDLAENTLVLFFSDNGANRQGSNAKLHGNKGSVWEGGHRVPAVAYWPGRIKPGTQCDETAITLDIMPTLLDLAGVKPDDARPLDGLSLVPVLRQQHKLASRTLFWGTPRQRAVRDGPWKLVYIGKGKNSLPMLFNLTDDPSELHDLAESHSAKVVDLEKQLANWEHEVGPSVFQR